MKFISTSEKARGHYPLGISYLNKSKHGVNELSKPYKSQVNDLTGIATYLGMYDTPEEAHRVYLKAKLKQFEDYLVEFKGDELIAKGLSRIKNKIEYHIDNNLELTTF